MVEEQQEKENIASRRKYKELKQTTKKKKKKSKSKSKSKSKMTYLNSISFGGFGILALHSSQASVVKLLVEVQIWNLID
jgi:hypothetical protein